jgi:hypothetical protein
LRPASLGDEVYTPSPRRSEGWRANLGSLSEPRHEQNLSANPKRTAKFISFVISDQPHFTLFKKFTKKFSKSYQVFTPYENAAFIGK